MICSYHQTAYCSHFSILRSRWSYICLKFLLLYPGLCFSFAWFVANARTVLFYPNLTLYLLFLLIILVSLFLSFWIDCFWLDCDCLPIQTAWLITSKIDSPATPIFCDGQQISQFRILIWYALFLFSYLKLFSWPQPTYSVFIKSTGSFTWVAAQAPAKF